MHLGTADPSPGIPARGAKAMATRRRVPAEDAILSPFPEGWYFVATREAVLKDKLVQKTWMGENVVVWCDDNGRVCVAEAVCPHLGADLGPAAGGCIRGGRLLCPFHGYEFDATGQCVATPFADPPRTAKLRVFETQEVLGLIFAWWGIDGREPQWSLPVGTLDGEGWSGFEISTLRFPGHPQETTENSVDLAHLRYVHGYDNVEPVEQALVDGHLLQASFDFKRKRTIAGAVNLIFDVSASASIYGLGYSFVDIREKSIGMNMRLWVLATPVDGTLIDLTLVSQVSEIRSPKRLIVGLGFLPVRTARVPHQQVHGVPAEGRRRAGRHHLEQQAVRFAPAPLPLGRQDHALQVLLRPVLPRPWRLQRLHPLSRERLGSRPCRRSCEGRIPVPRNRPPPRGAARGAPTIQALRLPEPRPVQYPPVVVEPRPSPRDRRTGSPRPAALRRRGPVTKTRLLAVHQRVRAAVPRPPPALDEPEQVDQQRHVAHVMDDVLERPPP